MKTDLGWMIMPGTMGEMTTHGLDNLYERSVQVSLMRRRFRGL